jgi:hypothetical protein
MRETFELLRNEIRAAWGRHAPGRDHPDGGGAQLAVSPSLAARSSRCRFRIAAPAGSGACRHLLNPSYSTAVGLLQWGATSLTAGEPTRYESARRRWRASAGSATPSGASSRRHARADGPDGERTRAVRPDRGLRRVRRRGSAARTGCCRCSSRTPRPARHRRDRGRVGRRPAAALDRLLPREERLYRHRHGSPGHGADHVLPLLAPPSLTVPVMAAGSARDVAVDLPARSERGQRRPDGAPGVPGGLEPLRAGGPRPSRRAPGATNVSRSPLHRGASPPSAGCIPGRLRDEQHDARGRTSCGTVRGSKRGAKRRTMRMYR